MYISLVLLQGISTATAHTGKKDNHTVHLLETMANSPRKSSRRADNVAQGTLCAVDSNNGQSSIPLRRKTVGHVQPARNRRGGALDRVLTTSNDMPGINLPPQCQTFWRPSQSTNERVWWASPQPIEPNAQPYHVQWTSSQEIENEARECVARERAVEEREKVRQNWLKRLRPRKPTGPVWGDRGVRSASENGRSK